MMIKNNLPKGWFSNLDIVTYRELISSLPDNSCIAELGSWVGRSICSVADLIIKKNIKTYIVDTFKGTENEGNAHAEANQICLYEEFYNNIKSFGLENFITIYSTTTDLAFEILKNEGVKFDLVFIDADHSTEAVTKDITNYSSLLKNNLSVLAGHDFSWESVRKALENTISDRTYLYSHNNMWWINSSDLNIPYTNSLFEDEIEQTVSVIEKNIYDVTAVVCTKDRYDYLFNTLLCIINQTVTPIYIHIYDDSSNRIDIENIFSWTSLFKIATDKGITIHIIRTHNNGQNKNHQQSINDVSTKYIWRVDDDLIFDNNVLKSLYFTSPKVGAVAPRVIMPNNSLKFNEVSGKISDVFTKAGIQLCVDNEGLHEVEHLHCTFLYDKTLGVNYHPNLSQVGHREETIFSHRIFKKGYKLLVNLDVTVYHLKVPFGGIRSEGVTNEMFEHDEKLFLEELNNINSKQKNNTFFAHLNNGIGDHFVFKTLIEQIKEKYEEIILAVTYPNVFWDIEGVSLISIEEGKKLIKENFKEFTEDNFSIYNVMDAFKEEFSKKDENHILQAYKKLYNL